MIVWIVTAEWGEFSDHVEWIEAVCATRELADQRVAALLSWRRQAPGAGADREAWRAWGRSAPSDTSRQRDFLLVSEECPRFEISPHVIIE